MECHESHRARVSRIERRAILWDGGYGKTLLQTRNGVPVARTHWVNGFASRLARERGGENTCRRAGWVSKLLLESLRKQCNHPAQGLTGTNWWACTALEPPNVVSRVRPRGSAVGLQPVGQREVAISDRPHARTMKARRDRGTSCLCSLWPERGHVAPLPAAAAGPPAGEWRPSRRAPLCERRCPGRRGRSRATGSRRLGVGLLFVVPTLPVAGRVLRRPRRSGLKGAQSEAIRAI